MPYHNIRLSLSVVLYYVWIICMLVYGRIILVIMCKSYNEIIQHEIRYTFILNSNLNYEFHSKMFIFIQCKSPAYQIV